jgi:uroporphyrinogen decarboxylase
MTGDDEILGALCRSIIHGDVDGAAEAARRVIENDVDVHKALSFACNDTMQVLGELFEERKIFVPEVLLSSRAANAAIDILHSYLSQNNGAHNEGTVVLGVTSGDFHDIGKNMVKMMLELGGFKVYDLGTDTTAEAFLEKANEVDADIVGVSALMTTSMENMIDVVNLFLEKRDDIKVMVGGAPVTEEFALMIGAEGYADDAVKTVDLARTLVKKRAATLKGRRRKVSPMQRVMMTLRGEIPDMVPTAPPFQGYWALHHAGMTVGQSIEHPELAAKTQYKEVRNCGFDAYECMWDWLAPVEVVGGHVRIEPKGNPVTIEPLIKRIEDVDTLEMPDLQTHERIISAIEAATAINELNDDSRFTYATLAMPFTLAAELRGTQNLMMDLYVNREHVFNLLTYCTNVTIEFSRLLQEAGITAYLFCDPVASGDLISAEIFEEFSLPFINDVFNHFSGSDEKTALHICGNIEDRLDLFRGMECDAISIDSHVDLAFARRMLSDRFTIIGNVSALETLYMSSPDKVRVEARKCIEEMGGKGLVLASGCDITVGTPVQNLRTLTLTPKEFM